MAVRALVALAVAAVVSMSDAADTYFTGDGTSYTLGQIGSGNCNFMSAIPTASTNYVALNQPQWNNLGNCGRCAQVSCIDSACAKMKNATRIVQVLDRCPECKSGDLDLSPSVFKDITGSSPSRFKIKWKFVDCPNPGTLKVCLKEGSNPWWIAVQPTNFRTGIKSVTINGKTTAMLDGAYYFVITSTTETNLKALKVAVTSIEGKTITSTLSLTAGSCADTKQQF